MINHFLHLLKGKYGSLIPDIKGHAHKQIIDPFVKVYGSFGIRGRSIVIHNPDVNKTRLDCANIKIVHSHKRSLTRLI